MKWPLSAGGVCIGHFVWEPSRGLDREEGLASGARGERPAPCVLEVRGQVSSLRTFHSAEHLLRTSSTSRPASLPRVPAMESAKTISGTALHLSRPLEVHLEGLLMELSSFSLGSFNLTCLFN